MVSKVTVAAVCVLASLSGASALAITWGFPSQLGVHAYPPVYIQTAEPLSLDWSGAVPHGVYILSPGTGVGCPSAFNAVAAGQGAPGLVGVVGKSGNYTFIADEPGIYNLACPVGDHCQDGMLLQITVVSGAVPSSAPSLGPVLAPADAPGAAPSAATPTVATAG